MFNALLQQRFHPAPPTSPLAGLDAQRQPLMDTAHFPGKLSDTKGGTEYEMHARSVALLRLTTPEKKEEQTTGFVAAEIASPSA